MLKISIKNFTFKQISFFTAQLKKMKAKLLLLSCFAIFATFISRANDTPPETDIKKDEINGSVVHLDTKKPLNNVIVTAYSSSKKEKIVITDGNGNYNFDELKPGTYKFVFEKNGFKRVTKDKVVVKTDESFQLNIEMDEHQSFDFMPGPFQFSDFED